eukprot:jgi/Picsp_1/761/NSC_04250-R1_sn1-specific diacylglycerol lipase beta
MPQLRLFNRRWRASTDTVPLLAWFLMLINICILVLLIGIITIMESGDYHCNQRLQLRVAVISILSIYAANIVVDRAISIFGWRGGPFEEKKRRMVGPMLYVKLLLLVCLVGFTCYGTYLDRSSVVGSECWSKSPCSAVKDYVPQTCLDGEYYTEGVELSKECMILSKQWRKINPCYLQWLGLGEQWGSLAYDPKFNPPFDFDVDFSSCSWPLNETVLGILRNKSQIDAAILQAIEPSFVAEYFPNVLRLFLNNLSIPYDPEYPAYGSPWSHCLDQKSCAVIYNNTCEQQDVLLSLPDPGNKKIMFDAVVYTSWAVICVHFFVFLLAFNAHPDYSTEESWQSTVEQISSLMCCKSIIKEATTDSGLAASEEIGNLLQRLFGGIDMDFTDRVLGAYLASERMRWRRLKYVQTVLSMYRYDPVRSSKSFWNKVCCSVDWDETEDLEVFMEDTTTSQTKSVTSTRVSGMLPNVNVDDISVHNNSPEYSLDSVPSLRLMHSMVRLESSSLESHMNVPGPVSMNRQSGQTVSTAFSRESVKRIKVKNRSRKIVTPLDLKDFKFDPPISDLQASRLYMSPKIGVPKSVLEQAFHYTWFAKAAYGLQKKQWKGATTGNWLTDSVDSLLSGKCFAPFSGPLALSSRFERRNFDAILGYTGIPPEDFLYVSYVSSSFGLLPYMVILDKKSKTVIISIRGTCGFADLVTDLLSKSVDVASILPEWVFERLPKNEDGSSKQCFGHAGILSSSKAILKDLEENGLIRAMLDIDMATLDSHAESVQPDSELSKSVRSDVNISFSLSRAKSMVSEAVAGQGWGVVVTGHSLGAAVATMISFKLRTDFSTLQCYAFNPPGGVISPELSELAREFCTSVIVGYDAISRLSLQTVQELVDDMVSSLFRCKRPKLTILIDHLLGRRKDPSMAPKTFGKFDSLSPEIKAVLEQYLAQSQLHQERLETTPLCPGGTVILMRPYSVRKDVVRRFRKDEISFEDIWEAVYVDSDEVLNEGLVLTRTSIGHHRVSVLQDSLESAIKMLDD